MGQTSSTFVDHDAANVDIPGKGKLIGRVGKDKTTGQLKSQRYAGIPFAQAPLGPLRWKRPQPLPPSFRYDSDGRKYVDFAAQSLQPTNYALTNGITFPDAPTFPQSEDCLYLNVWCPVQADGSRPPGKRPVLFFIHGGWLQVGNAKFSPNADPSDLLHAAGLDAVIVTTAYRLNVFGFLAHDALRNEDPDHLTGNYGFWDQRAALEWVYHNIEHFGGDPTNITVSGLSAGAHSTHMQLMHEFDLSTQDACYNPMIRRIFLQSNAAIWPSKSVTETRDQFDELATLLDLPAHLSDIEKIARLREVDALALVRVLETMNMHTFRATRDTRNQAFVKQDWTSAMMDGRLARWCQQQGVWFVIGECADEEWVYRNINTPTDQADLVRQVNNYYMLSLVEKMLPYYGVKMDQQTARNDQQSFKGSTSSARSTGEEASLYQVLGVKPYATSAEIRAAYLAQVRRYHPDKLQQLAGSHTPCQFPSIDAGTVTDVLSCDELIRQLNHAYKVLGDDQLRMQYDESLAAAHACTESRSPRISATVEFESFHVSETQDSVAFSYPCRCGSTYNMAEDQVHDRVQVIGCDGCSEFIHVRYDDDDHDHDDEDGPHLADTAAWLTPHNVAHIFGRVCSDSQVYIAQRMLIHDLVAGGLSPDRILRYRINYRARAIDGALSAYRGVSHSFDDYIWWFSCLQPDEQVWIKQWLTPWILFVSGQEEQASREWYKGHVADPRLIRVLEQNGRLSVQADERWAEKDKLIEQMMRLRNELVQEW